MATLDNLFSRSNPLVPLRGVHLDLKGVPPTFERMLDLLGLIAAARYNAVLIEWEDMFPWTVDERFRCETAYSPQQVGAIHARARDLGIEVIPLVQSLGHVETPLSLPQYAPLREVPEMPDALNPLAPGGRELIEKMVDDVLALSPGLKFFHLGGDEAWTFGTHPDTKAYIAKHGKGALYLHHIGPLLDKLVARGIRPILWHDMMTEWDEPALRALSGRADLMVWGYHGHPDTIDSHYNSKHIERFKSCGVTMWGATAYKGGDGEDIDLPNYETRRINAEAWAEVAGRHAMRGVVATAWSRYSTHRVQNEPIDACLDALVGVGVILHDGRLPEGGFPALREVLPNLPEGRCYAECRRVMLEMGKARHWGWMTVKRARQHAAMFQLDPRRDSASSRKPFNELRDLVASFPGLESGVRKAFAGLIDKVWIDRYIHERLEPLRQEWSDIRGRVGL